MFMRIVSAFLTRTNGMLFEQQDAKASEIRFFNFYPDELRVPSPRHRLQPASKLNRLKSSSHRRGITFQRWVDDRGGEAILKYACIRFDVPSQLLQGDGNCG